MKTARNGQTSPHGPVNFAAIEGLDLRVQKIAGHHRQRYFEILKILVLGEHGDERFNLLALDETLPWQRHVGQLLHVQRAGKALHIF